MINTAKVTAALVTMLKNHPDLSDLKLVERGEYVNKDPAVTPYVGVYRTEVSYTPRALGHHSRSWGEQLTLKLVVQAHANGGMNAEDALEDVLQRVLTAVLGDLTLRTEMSMLNSLRVQYSYDETESNTMDFQWAFVTLVYETRTGI